MIKQHGVYVQERFGIDKSTHSSAHQLTKRQQFHTKKKTKKKTKKNQKNKVQIKHVHDSINYRL
jgi:hypothetical protein